jgi:hypothetical protein
MGVLQLLNARHESGNIVPFSETDQRLTESLASRLGSSPLFRQCDWFTRCAPCRRPLGLKQKRRLHKQAPFCC